MRRTWLALFLLSCSYEHGTGEVPGDGRIDDIDGPPADARVDTPPDSVCFGTAFLVECYPNGQAPTDTYEPTGQLDTTDPTSCTRVIPQVNGPELCLRAAGTIKISQYVRWKGSRPLLLLASETITVADAGTLDVSSFRIDVGAGGDTGECATGGGGGANTSLGTGAGAGGGGGGGFGSSGGDGAAGQGVQGGDHGGTTALAQIRGGCPGARGGTSSTGPGGEGGHGGGAVYLVAGSSITIAGTIRANGSGGGGGPNKAGGGGGGSGGLIVFDAPAVTLTGTLFANGGGGGEGGGGSKFGSDGEDPSVYNLHAAGGATNTAGGDGGAGSVFATAGASGDADTNGGGGGGGGAGRIKVFQATVPIGRVSPPAN